MYNICCQLKIGKIISKGGALICYIQIIAKIRKFDTASSYLDGAGYAEFIKFIGENISLCPLYLNSFDYLVYEILDGKKMKQKDLMAICSYNRQTLHNHIYGNNNSKIKTIRICIALGLDLVMTMIFLMSKGFILNYYDESDRKMMEFIDTFKKKEYDKLDEFDERFH